MTEEKILKKPDGSYVLLAFKSVGMDSSCPSAKDMHGFTNNGFPKNMPPEAEEPSVWDMLRGVAHSR